MNRRQFIKAGVVGGAALAAGGAWVGWRDRDRSNVEALALKRQHRIDAIVGAIAPVMLGTALPSDPVARTQSLQRVTADVGHVIANFTPPVQKEVHELFALLDVSVARWALTGVSRDWRDMHNGDPAEIAAFLERWRRSSFETLQSGYHALHDLILGAWYASPRAWTAIGYAGPPTL